jgi:hypothetical protein
MANKYLSIGLLSFILLAIMYSFGTFGFLNLLGARTIVQISLVGLVASILIELQPQYKPQEVFPALAFFGLYAIGSLIHGNIITGPVEAVLMLFCVHVICTASLRRINIFAKILVIVTSFLCLLVAIAYIYYKINPDQFIRANFHIYDSTVGHQQVFAGHFMDWISFTSGDGFQFLGESSQRMKGYSNEPSSTVVHYLAPAVLGFLLGGRFIFLSIFILLVNFIAISAFTGQLIIALSFILFLIIKLFRRLLKYFIPIIAIFFVALLTKSNLMVVILKYFSDQAINYLDFDLISRKLGDGFEDSSFGVRQSGIIDGLTLALSSPLGYSSRSLGAGAGLVYIVSSFTGWLGLVIFGLFLFKLLNNVRKLALATDLSKVMYSLALLCSVLLITLFISAYGWDRPPGVIMLFLFYRIVQLSAVHGYSLMPLTKQQRVYPKACL